jgi:hypothetical protein
MILDCRSAAVYLAVATLAGCSTSAPESTPLINTVVPGQKLAADPAKQPFNFTTAAGPAAPGGEGQGYTLSAEELAYDCKKLSGRIQIRILDIRGYETREKTTLASRGLHTAGKMVMGGTNTGLNTDAQFAKDKAMLKAYNSQLVAKDCRSFNIAEALAGTGVPSPTIEAPSKAKTKTGADPVPKP